MSKHKSKVKSLSPMMQNGVQMTWSNQGNTMYNLTLETEAGHKGTYSSTKPEGSVNVGDEIVYEISESNGYTNFRGVKKAERYGGNGGGGYRGRSVDETIKVNLHQERIKAPGFAMSYAKDLAVAGVIEMKQLLTSADKIESWITDKLNKIESNESE